MKKHLTLIILTLSSINLFAQVPNYVPTNGLVGYWPFNGNANDLSGNNYNGVAMNGAVLTTDRFNNSDFAYNFDGVNDLVQTNLPYTILSNSTGFSGSAWIKLGSLDSYFGQTIVSNFSPSNTQFSFAIVGSENPANIRHLIVFYKPTNTTGQVMICPTDPIIIDAWTHVAFTVSTNFIRFYINGVMINEQQSNFAALGQESNNVPNVKIGQGNPTNGFRQDFNGKLDEIGIWNRALTQCEIQDLYNEELNSLNVNAGLDQEICQGQSTSLFGTGASNYSWSNNVVNGVGFVPASSSNYIVTGTDANGCIGTDTMHVELIPTSSSTLTETALDLYTLNGQVFTESGTYTQVIPNAAGCDSTITLNLSLDFTGISELDKEFSIAPNPATDQLTISSSTVNNDNYILFDPQGRKVLSGSLTGATTQLDLSKLVRGNYLLQIGEKLTPVKLVKE